MLVNHLGLPLKEGLDFFASPPESIGTIRSQYSTRLANDTSTVNKNHVWMSVGYFVVAIVCGAIYLKTNNVFAIAGALLFAGFAGLRTLNTKRFECNYVGTKGVARYRVGTKDIETPALEGGVHLFEAFENLFTNVIETNGILPFYGQNAIYQWVPKGAKRATFAILTDQYDPRELPTEEALIYFLRAAESAWTDSLIESARQLLDSDNTVEFEYRIGGKVVLSANDLRIEVNKSTLIRGGDLGAVRHEAGDLQFLSRAGEKLGTLNCFHLANVLLLETLICERFGLVRNDSGLGA